MLRTFVQIMRRGAMGRKSLGSRPKRLVQEWLNTATEAQLLQASIGAAPSLADVVKMVHPKPAEAWRAALFAWLIGKSVRRGGAAPATLAFEAVQAGAGRGPLDQLPDVPFQMLTTLSLTPRSSGRRWRWRGLAEAADEPQHARAPAGRSR